jgi:hypothetical protein
MGQDVVETGAEHDGRGEAGARRAPSLRMLADTPLADRREDQLGFGVYADALAELIDHPTTRTPLTIAISAPWGAGKTSLARLVEQRLEEWRRESGQQPHVTCWFNAWAHDDADHLGAAFAAEVARTVDRARPWWRRVRAPLATRMLLPRDRWRRRVRLALVALVPALAIVVAPGLADAVGGSSIESELDAALGARAAALAVGVVLVASVWKKLFAATETAARFLDEPVSEAAHGSMREVAAELGRLVEEARTGDRKVVVFVDDLERCRPPRALEVCEVAGNLLAHDGVVTILIADMGVIAASAELKYRALESHEDGAGTAPGEYGRRYLQKLVQIQFDLPPSRVEKVRELLEHEAAGAVTQAAEEAVPAEPHWWTRAKLIGEQVAVGLMAVCALASGVWFAVRPPDGSDDRGSAFFVGALAGIVVFALAAAVVRAVVRVVETAVRWVRDRARRRLLQRIEADVIQLAKTRDDPVWLLARIEQQHGAGSAAADFAHRRVMRYYTEESSLRVRAEDQLAQHLPLLPRGAKRMLNHLRLRLYVAVERGLFTDTFDPAHVGKWVVLEERWPDLARAIKERPATLADAERAAAGSGLADVVAGLGMNGAPTGDLERFLTTEPRLAAFAEPLVFLEPATPD